MPAFECREHELGVAQWPYSNESSHSILFVPIPAEFFNSPGVKRDAPRAGGRLGGSFDPVPLGTPDDLRPDAELGSSEIHGVPREAEQLRAPHARRRREMEERPEMVATGVLEEREELLGRPHGHSRSSVVNDSRHTWRLGPFARIPLDELPAARVAVRLVKRPVNVAHGGRRERPALGAAVAEQLRIEPVEICARHGL